MPLPRILAGPIVRRADRRAVWIWLCTNDRVNNIGAEFYQLTDDNQIGERVGTSESVRHVQLGQHCFIYMIRVTPLAGRFPHTEEMPYRLFENYPATPNILSGYDETLFGIGPYNFPILSLQNPDRDELKALFGSCRKLHDEDNDASGGMLVHFRRNLPDIEGTAASRPTSLLLLGDQIYADDVSDNLYPLIKKISLELGLAEHLEDLIPLTSLNDPDAALTTLRSVAGRQDIITRHAGFTSNEASNHLITLSEYIAMYLLSWNELTWDSLPDGRELLSTRHTPPENEEDYLREIAQININLHNSQILGSGSIKRLFANISTYMMFDDHDVTDDWNINPSWVRHVQTKPLGKRIIVNALIAYWAFQGWGNAPDSFDDAFIERINLYLSERQDSADAAFLRDNEMFAYLNNSSDPTNQIWSFTTTTRPVVYFFDFRTKRTASTDTRIQDEIVNILGDLPVRQRGINRIRDTHLPPALRNSRLNGMAPRLLNNSLKQYATRILRNAANKPMILVTGTPVIGSNIVDLGQEITIRYSGSFTWDFESWRGDPESLLDLYELIRRARPSVCAILSGDVHYGSSFIGSLNWVEGTDLHTIPIGQFTSSALKNRNYISDALVAFRRFLLGDDFFAQWLYDRPGRSDVSGTPTGRIVSNHDPTMLSRILTTALASPNLIGFFNNFQRVYCEESWKMHNQRHGFIVQSNFGYLKALRNTTPIRVQMYNAAGAEIGDEAILSPGASRSQTSLYRLEEQARHFNFQTIPHHLKAEARMFAKLCDDVYRATSSTAEGWVVVEGDENGDIFIDGIEITKIRRLNDAESGFFARIYYNSAQNLYVLCFRGSELEDWGDWWNNIQQICGLNSRQYQLALQLSRQFARIPARYRRILTGHSLGGGLASAGACITGLETVTFEAAGIRSETLHGQGDITALLSNGQTVTTAYYIDGEILSALQDGEIARQTFISLSQALGKRIYVPSELTNNLLRLRFPNDVRLMSTRVNMHMPATLVRVIEQATGGA